MGLLSTGGAPMKWGTKENDKAIPYVLSHGVTQFLNVYKRYKNLENYPFLWGEELEHLVVVFAEDGKSVKLSLTADDIIQELRKNGTAPVKWLPEYGSFMIETTPDAPYSSEKARLLSCEDNLDSRYNALRELCAKSKDKVSVVTVVAFPMMGVGDFVAPLADGTVPKPQGEYAMSLFVPDACINNTHPRFGNLTRNIRLRRQRKVCIQIPMFIDTNTMAEAVDEKYRIDKHPMNSRIDCAAVTNETKTRSFDDDSEDEEEAPPVKGKPAAQPTADAVFSHLYTPATNYYYAQYTAQGDAKNENVKQRFDACPCPVPSVAHPCVYMDCMAYGMGCACLQVTMQFQDINEARHMFDQLAVLTPMMLALTAATPIQKGYLCDSDVRWLTIAASVDCRQRREVPRIIKSRYDSVSLFISPEPKDLSLFNDNHVEIDEKVAARLQKEGLDERLAHHVSHLFIRDPLVIFDENIEQCDDETQTDHFENIQSTNWQTVRFKPPPFDSDIGWRVEFRVMEVSVTAFENAAFSVFMVLLTQAILKYKLWLYMPMSKVDENMGRAHFRDPVQQKFWWPKTTTEQQNQGEVEQLSMDQLFNGTAKGKGCANGFEGFVPIVRRFSKEQGTYDAKVERYIQLVSGRASGKLHTTASFFREFVRTHPEYKGDSRLSDQIAHDLLKMTQRLADGEVAFDNFLPPELLFGDAAKVAAARASKRGRDE
jgi:glutamate--cysteine ligase catalytic subunit